MVRLRIHVILGQLQHTIMAEGLVEVLTNLYLITTIDHFAINQLMPLAIVEVPTQPYIREAHPQWLQVEEVEQGTLSLQMEARHE